MVHAEYVECGQVVCGNADLDQLPELEQELRLDHAQTFAELLERDRRLGAHVLGTNAIQARHGPDLAGLGLDSDGPLDADTVGVVSRATVDDDGVHLVGFEVDLFFAQGEFATVVANVGIRVVLEAAACGEATGARQSGRGVLNLCIQSRDEGDGKDHVWVLCSSSSPSNAERISR